MSPLRPQLEPPVPDPALVERLTELTLAIERVPDGADGVTPLVAAFNELTGKSYTPYDFWAYYGEMSRETFVERAARPDPTRDPAVTREELVEVVRRLQSGLLTGGEEAYYLRVLEVSTPHPDVWGLLYSGESERSAEEVVMAAISYRPIELPAGAPARGAV